MPEFTMKMKEIPDSITKDNPMWDIIELNALEKGRYSISTNGDLYDNFEQCEVSSFYYKDRIHKFALLKRIDGTCSQFNVTMIMMKTFVSDDVCARTKFYFKDRNYHNLYIRNIGICRANVAQIPDEKIHVICKMIQSGLSDEDICNEFNYIRKDAMKPFIKKIKDKKIKINISKNYII